MANYTEINNLNSPNFTAGRGGKSITGITIHAEIIRQKNDWIKVDPEFEYLLYENVWSCSGGYAKRYKEKFDGVKRHRWVEYLHRLVLDAGSCEVVDHINQDKSDNRRKNLRVVGKSENLLNTSKNKGFVERTLKNGEKRFDVRLQYKGKVLIRKTFSALEEALKEYNTVKEGVLSGL
jgi:hypothetical protein